MSLDLDAYSDLPQGHAIPPLTLASTGDGLGGNGQILGNDFASVGGDINAGTSFQGICKKCAWFWIGVTGVLVFLVWQRHRFV